MINIKLTPDLVLTGTHRSVSVKRTYKKASAKNILSFLDSFEKEIGIPLTNKKHLVERIQLKIIRMQKGTVRKRKMTEREALDNLGNHLTNILNKMIEQGY